MNSKTIKKFILDIIYPNRCPFCDSFIKWDKLACDKCIEALPYVPENICTECGKFPCECDKEIRFYDKCYTVCFYDEIARNGILSLKSKNGINAAEFFSNVLSERLKKTEHPNLIIPVPATEEKKRIRGYNQAEIIAGYISDLLGAPVADDILFKRSDLPEQHSLTASERKHNAENMFYIDKNNDLRNTTVILCDDVITTGSTLNECSKLLKQNGASKVICAVCTTTM